MAEVDLRFLSERVRKLTDEISHLRSGGGGGTSGGMDGLTPRVARLEAHMERVRDDLGKLSSVPADLARLTERVAHLPSKGYIAAWGSGAIGLLIAAITFAEKLQALVR